MICSVPDHIWKNRRGRVIYFAGPVGGPIKIGRTANLARRMKELRCSSPDEVCLWAVASGASLDEGAYHLRYAATRIRGEWFHRTPEIEAEIVRLMQKEKPA